MKVTSIKGDKGPWLAMKQVDEELKKMGHTVFPFYNKAGAFNEPMLDEMREAIKQSDKVITTMSSLQATLDAEVEAVRVALSKNIPVGCYSCSYNEWQGPLKLRPENFGRYMDKLSFLFVTSKDEVGPAEKLATSARVHACGSPEFERFFKPSQMSREEGRALFGATEEETLIAIMGSKELYRTGALVMSAIEALNGLDGPFRSVVCYHPGNQYVRVEEVAPEVLYGELLAESNNNHPIMLKNPSIETSDIFPAVDIVVSEFSLTGIEAAAKRRPVIDIASYFGRKWLKDLTDKEMWFPAKVGASVQTSTVEDTMVAVTDLSDPDSELSQSVKVNQIANFRQEEFEGSARRIAEALVA